MKSCLIVVGYQNDFVSGALGFAGAGALDVLRGLHIDILQAGRYA